MSHNLQRLYSEQGQSPWLDNLQRGYVTSGELRRLIDLGVRGLTSNPTIFQKAIQGSSDYDEEFARETTRGATPEDAYWTMVVSDIEAALEAFMPVFDSSGGTDGFVSVEVDPSLAHDTFGTLEAARSLASRITQPNVMIKIPATTEGIPAIRTMIAEGRNVNVTLIFSLDRYSEVLQAYLDGLRERHSHGFSVAGIASVASFFISRVDSEVDPRLEAIGTADALALRGKAAVCQAKLAYELCRDAFSGPDWEVLAASGAVAQRPLWASTSTKNPAYADTKYVDALIGPGSVNTLPDATLHAFADHGVVARTIDSGLDEARSDWDKLATVGIDMTAVSSKLEAEGVASFQKSFVELIQALSDKARDLGDG